MLRKHVYLKATIIIKQRIKEETDTGHEVLVITDNCSTEVTADNIARSLYPGESTRYIPYINPHDPG